MILMKLESCNTFSKKYSNTKFNLNLSSGSLNVTCRHTDRQTKMIKLTVAFHNFAYTTKVNHLTVIPQRTSNQFTSLCFNKMHKLLPIFQLLNQILLI